MSIIVQAKRQVEFSTNTIEANVSPTAGCNGTQALWLSGHGVTDGAGKWTLALPTVVCPNLRPYDDNRPSFVAFPLNDDKPQPVVLSGAVDPGGVVLVQAWTLGGAAAPRVKFAWHCVIPTTR